jgi:hypothetical protein
MLSNPSALDILNDPGLGLRFKVDAHHLALIGEPDGIVAVVKRNLPRLGDFSPPVIVGEVLTDPVELPLLGFSRSRVGPRGIS